MSRVCKYVGNCVVLKTQPRLFRDLFVMDRYHINGLIEITGVRFPLWTQIKGAHVSENDANAHCYGHLPVRYARFV